MVYLAHTRRVLRLTSRFLFASCLLALLAGCNERPASTAAFEDAPLQSPAAPAAPDSASVPAWLGKPLASVRDASKPPVVLFDSYHAHNFLHRGLVPGEHTYHRFTGLRRAAEMLEERGCEVRELLVGPITARQLAGVQLVVLNLPSIDRPPWLVSEIAAIEEYVRQGGGIIFITDHSNCYYHQYHVLPLWDRLGLTPTFETVCERKAECMLAPTGAGWVLVRDFVQHPVTEGVRYFATQTGGRVVGEGVVAWTSDQAWADTGVVPLYGEGSMGLFGDMRYSDSEEQGKQGIILARGVGLGRVTVISDQNSVGDAFISYADNWRLWLSACKWCGQFQWDDASKSGAGETTSNAQDDRAIAPAGETPGPSTSPIADKASDGSAFDAIVAAEPDRNAAPAMSPEAWAIHCWEPLGSARFRWGGNDPEQYYYFWCWMNRWLWVTANDQPQRPREHDRGRPMLLVVDREADDEPLIAFAQQTLARGGKVVLLPEKDQAIDGSPSDDQVRRAIERAKKFVEPNSLTVRQAQWSAEPVPHWHLKAAEGTLVIIASAANLRNAKFAQPEIAPNATILKWENELRQWLFEQP